MGAEGGGGAQGRLTAARPCPAFARFGEGRRSSGVPGRAIGGAARAAMFQFERDAPLAAKQWGSILAANVSSRDDGSRIRRVRVAFARNGDGVAPEGAGES